MNFKSKFQFEIITHKSAAHLTQEVQGRTPPTGGFRCYIFDQAGEVMLDLVWTGFEDLTDQILQFLSFHRLRRRGQEVCQ
jgi:hypothetical protein